MNLDQLNKKWEAGLHKIYGAPDHGKYRIQPDWIVEDATGKSFITIDLVEFDGVLKQEVDTILTVPVDGWIRDAGVETAYRWIFRMADRELDRLLHGLMSLPALNSKWEEFLPDLFPYQGLTLDDNYRLEAHVDSAAGCPNITIFLHGDQPDVTEAEYMESCQVCSTQFYDRGKAINRMFDIVCRDADEVLEEMKKGLEEREND